MTALQELLLWCFNHLWRGQGKGFNFFGEGYGGEEHFSRPCSPVSLSPYLTLNVLSLGYLGGGGQDDQPPNKDT